MNREKPVTGEIYHIYNRGVDKRDIFTNNSDRYRFIHDLYEFNDKNPVVNMNYKFSKSIEVELPINQPREKLVEICSFCMMPNHFHLMLRQISNNGISEFMRKLGTGYTNYFNKKYERSGALFQGRYKFILMKNETQFINLPFYIHFNPLKLVYPDWKDKGVGDIKKAIDYLQDYRWSSFKDFIGEKNFPSLLDQSFLSEYFVDLKYVNKFLLNLSKLNFDNWVSKLSLV
jgi:putative transposase